MEKMEKMKYIEEFKIESVSQVIKNGYVIRETDLRGLFRTLCQSSSNS